MYGTLELLTINYNYTIYIYVCVCVIHNYRPMNDI